MSPTAYDVDAVRADFPILSQSWNGRPLVFLDTGASAQKPRAVIDAMTRMMENDYANVHRGSYWLSERSTAVYEGARDTVARFLNAASSDEIVFTLNGTDAINLVANTWGRTNVGPDRAILISEMEHHANIVPWQMLRDATGARLLVCPILDDGSLDMEAYARLLQDNPVALVAITQTSNVLGTVTPAAEIVRLAHEAGARVLLDGCQGIVHGPVDLQALDVDFYVFSAHKLYGPTGLGVLFGKSELLEAMPPWRGGGDMIETVTFEHTTWARPPARFEAGTPAIVEAAGLTAAIEYINALGPDAIRAHESALLAYATEALGEIEGLVLYGRAPEKSAVLSFTIDGIHAHDLGMLLGESGVCVRVGHHCAMPLLKRLGVTATTRASLGCYTNTADIDALVVALKKARSLLL
ncbi:cysteine desulfurase [Phaeovibrio sulfidiphilus]|uniref:Cysteine desulfurase n=1 Tax=Phaeovibrio sulfidiphilus TaxID=1220600 RepID=A0A8J6YJS8_9PROT|nr:cysteine desulfurase [Phaeovibrio sulfidiphilus]MBE1237686.1 cysteine desulfurase [Phaeovibrio sulfidiphilus]